MSATSSSTRNIEIGTGLAVIAAATAFLVFALRTTGDSGLGSGKGYKVTAEFDNIEGINVGTDIRLAGIKVGSVIGQTLNPENYQARVEMSIDQTIALSDDTTAKITSEGLLGSKFIALEPGGSEDKIADGGLISYTQGAVDIWSLISQAMFERSGAQDKKSGEKSAPEPDAPPDAPPETPPAAQP
jgi:phospholipid/cholesterol/gamma-HCH transport system substrate-binding protein